MKHSALQDSRYETPSILSGGRRLLLASMAAAALAPATLMAADKAGHGSAPASASSLDAILDQAQSLSALETVIVSQHGRILADRGS